MTRTDIKPFWDNNKQCKKCLYRLYVSNEYVCGFMYYTGKRRPCEPSPHCTAFEKYTQKERMKLETNMHKLGGF